MACSSRPTVLTKKSSGPKVLPHEIAFALSIDPGQMDRALALDEADQPATPRISAGWKAACRQDRASDALPRPSIPSGARACETPRPDGAVTLDTESCADISE